MLESSHVQLLLESEVPDETGSWRNKRGLGASLRVLSSSVILKGKPYMDNRGENIRGHGTSGNNQVGERGTNENNQGRGKLGSLNDRKNHKFFEKQPGRVHVEP